MRDMGEPVDSLLRGPVVLTTSGKPWLLHLKTYYKVPQYIGAVIILAGLVVSVWPSLSGSGLCRACRCVGVSVIHGAVAQNV